MKKEYKNCQSCGMPLARDEQRGGTEKTGSIAENIAATVTRMVNLRYPK